MDSKYTYSLFFTILICISSFAQKDTLTSNLDEVVVTATRTERRLSNVCIPTAIITQKNIQQAGSLRFKDLLQEQTGLFITSGSGASPQSDFGNGVQVQGLGSDYVLFLIDGEPIVGRIGGVLDINRLTVGNIKKIEIVKGPSSSLYGSDALAGVINIITEHPSYNKLNASVRYGTYNTTDANIGGTFHLSKLAINAFANSYTTDGFGFLGNTENRAIAPILRLTNQLKLSYPISQKTKLSVSLRYAYESISKLLAVQNIGATTYTSGKERRNDWNSNVSVTHSFSSQLKSSVRIYATQYLSTLNLNDGSSTSSIYSDTLNHRLIRFENQTDYTVSKQVSFSAGAGYSIEGVKSNRYTNSNIRENNHIGFAFIQSEYLPFKNLTIIGGLRYDINELYASACSPKLAILYKPSTAIRLTANIGAGFKVPDFRQLYLNFTNAAAGNYSVFGATEALNQINQLESEGKIASKLPNFNKLTALKPETSVGINIAANWQINTKASVNINVFRNDLKDLIDYQIVAYYNSGAQIYSYFNIKRAYTQGIELEASYRPIQELNITGGYQFLLTADKDDLQKIKDGTVYTRDYNGSARVMNRSEYLGLFDRSRHMANLKFSYETPTNFFANCRVIYRGQWAISDKDGNGMANTNDNFANGFVQLNVAAGKQWKNGCRVQLGIDNINNYIDAANLPNLPGRQLYALIAYSFNKHK